MPGILTSVSCNICGSSNGDPVYEGRIRAGRFGTLTKEDYRVIRCSSCGVDRLDPFPTDSNDYETGVYRQLVDGSSEISQYYLNHDQELADKLKLIGSAALRDKVVMDAGCGAGTFLDILKGIAARTIGVEPQRNFAATLKAKGHEHYAYARELAAAAPASVDMAVSFKVIEHVMEPQSFLIDIARCLKPGGRLHLTTPNRDDILMRIGPAAYRQFFYRIAHIWYFDVSSLRRASESAGFTVVQVSTPHSYDLSNFCVWLRDQRPSSLGAVPELLGPTDAAFRAQIEAAGHGDAIYAVLERPA